MVFSLEDLNPGESGIITKIKDCRNIMRRFMDIGLIENTIVKCVGKSPGGDPKAYLIRGAVIAIRSEDSKNVFINRITGE